MPATDSATRRPLDDVGPPLLLGLLVLLPGLLAPWAGAWALGLSGLLLLLALAIRATATRREWWTTLATTAALLGGVVGVYSAGFAIATLGAVPPYDGRVGFGWLALGLAIFATAAGIVARVRPVAGSVLMVLVGLLGAGATGLFSTNTFYVAAMPLWLLAAVFTLARPRRAR